LRLLSTSKEHLNKVSVNNSPAARAQSFLARTYAGKMLYCIMLPDSVADRYTAILAYPYDGSEPIAVQHVVKALGHQHYALCDTKGGVLREFASGIDAMAFETACMMADDLGLPWRVEGGSEVYDPATARCWSLRALYDIDTAASRTLH